MKRCSHCKYRATFNYAGIKWYCAYFLATGNRRPCPVDDCTVFIGGKKPYSDNMNKLTISRKSAEKKKEKKLETLRRYNANKGE